MLPLHVALRGHHAIQTKLVQVITNPHEANGKLVAGTLWWACARCLTQMFVL
jgi:hypothetical protein